MADEKDGYKEAMVNYETDMEILTARGCCQPKRNTRQSSQLFQMLFLPCIPIIALIIQDALTMYHVLHTKNSLQHSMSQVEMSVQYGRLLAALQVERSDIAYSVFTNVSKERNLTESFRMTDVELDGLSQWPDFSDYKDSKMFESKFRFRIRLEDFRKTLIRFVGDKSSSDNEILGVVNWYNFANEAIMNVLDGIIKGSSSSGGGVWRLMIAYKNLLRALENFGISMVYGLLYFGRGALSRDSFSSFVRTTALAESYLNSSSNFAQLSDGLFINVTSMYKEYQELIRTRTLVLANANITGTITLADVYYNGMKDYLDRLGTTLDNFQLVIRDNIAVTLTLADRQMVVSVIVLVVVVAISPILVLVMHRVTNTTQMFALKLTHNAEQLKREKKRADTLLSQLLPEKIAAMLQSNTKVTAETFEAATIFFSDIVSFTKLCSDSTPIEVINMLNSLYRLFDTRLEMYDVYKVETIGDAYMVVSGIPERNGNKHASEISKMALDIVDGVENFRIPHRSDRQIQVRIGIHTGSCVAGVVGNIMPRYCLFGDTVNVANAMESSSEAMKIHVTHVTKAYLDELGGFFTEYRGTQNIKGKGQMTTFWLLGCANFVPTGMPVDTKEDEKPSVLTAISPDFLSEAMD